MTRPDQDTELLSAYIDGELDAAVAARIAQRIATDETIAQRAARMAEIKSAVAGLAQDVIVVAVPARRSSWLPFIGMGLPACLGLVVIASLWISGAREKLVTSFDQAIAQHDRWAGNAIAGSFAPAPASAPAALFAPEMIAAGLTLAFLRDDAVIDGKRAIQAGYVGLHGCHLSLFRTQSIFGGKPGFNLSSDGVSLRAFWTVASSEYLLVSRGMDEARFALIAGMLRSASQSGRQPEAYTIADLETLRRPCVG